MEGFVMNCTTVYFFVAAEAYNLAESADSIAIPIHCVASGTRSTACLRPLYHAHLSTLRPESPKSNL